MAQLSAHFNRVAAIGCCICGQPAQLHHATGGSMIERGVMRGMSQKVSDWLVIPLCERHHTGRDGIHAIGVDAWEGRYGSQAGWVDHVGGLLELDLWTLAKEPKERKYKRPKKVLPRD